MSDRPPPTATWEALGSVYYRRDEIYSMLWDLHSDLDDFIIAAARSGGPIALMRDSSKPQIVSGKQALGKPRIYIYSSSGVLLQTILWDATAKIVCFGFTAAESLVVLMQDGNYRLYPLSVNASSTSAGYSQHSLGQEAAESGVSDARIFESGMVALLRSLTFIHLNLWPEDSQDGVQRGQVTRLADPGISEAPNCWTAIPPEESASRQVEVLLSFSDTLVLLDALDAQDQHLQYGPYSHILPSPNGRFVALVTFSSNPAPKSELRVVSADFTKTLSTYDLSVEGEGTPDQACWCGSNTVLLSWGSDVVMVGPYGDVLRYDYLDAVHLVSEVDGARLLSKEKCEFLQKVPDSTLQIFRPGASSPSAMLYEAMADFDRKSPKADENIRSIRADLRSAVDTCIDAAGKEMDVYWQRRLLKAASYGKNFLDLYNPTDFVNMCKSLRVLNAARYYEVGIPITYEQYTKTSPTAFVSRLITRSLHLLSLKISGYLSISTAPVLKHWASAKVSQAKGGSAEDDARLCEVIVSRLKGQADVGCADVARTAWEKGQPGLASKLLEYETRASSQVPLLLSMKSDSLALQRAIASSDPDLVYTVLLHLRKSHSPSSFFKFIDNKPDAISLFRIWAKGEQRELLRDYYYQDDRRTESAALVLEEAKGLEESERMSKIKQAGKFYSEDRERVFESKMVEEQLRLMAYQQTLEKESDGRRHMVGLSVNETIRQCLILGWGRKADKIKNEWKVPEKRFWYVKLKALTEVRDWEGLEAMAKSKKSPIGYEPFVEHLATHGNHRQAVAFVPRCEAKNRVEMYIKCGEWIKAGEECKARGDTKKLQELLQRCPNNIIASSLQQMLETAD